MRPDEPTHDNPDDTLEDDDINETQLGTDLVPRDQRKRLVGARQRWRSTLLRFCDLATQAPAPIIRWVCSSKTPLIVSFARPLTRRLGAVPLLLPNSRI